MVEEAALPAELATLVAAERAFARRSVESGTRAAFLEFLAPDALIFRPRPEPGRAHWEGRPESSSVLAWEPEFAEVARAGDLGYTTGPWALSDRTDPGRPPACGRFVSIWRREAGGTWQVVIDLGIVHACPDSGPGVGLEVPAPRPEAPLAGSASDASIAAEILAADRALGRAATDGGLAAALEARATGDIRLLRSGQPPVRGRTAVRRALEGEHEGVHWDPVAAAGARSGDLGYSHGAAKSGADRGAGSDGMSYVRIWRREPGDSWRVALDIALPHPEQDGPGEG